MARREVASYGVTWDTSSNKAKFGFDLRREPGVLEKEVVTFTVDTTDQLQMLVSMFQAFPSVWYDDTTKELNFVGDSGRNSQQSVVGPLRQPNPGRMA